MSADEAVERGVLLYTEGAFFAAHEAWEERWRGAVEPERRALQGLIQIAAGYYKMFEQRRADAGARLLLRGADKLAEGPAVMLGLALAQFAADVRAGLADGAGAAPLLRYQAYYCEENAALLCRHPALAGRDPAAVFVRGAGGPCVVWDQRIAAEEQAPVCWDYHVVVLVRDPWEVWDLDTTLGCPAPAEVYVRRSFRPEVRLPAELRPRFRVVPAEALARTFASDRSHMRGPDGAYTQPPPPWAPLGEGSTLARLLAVGDPIAGEELTLAELLARVR